VTVFLPDTSILIDTLRPRPKYANLLRGLVTAGHSLACCAITVGETYSGMRSSEVSITTRLLSTLIWIETSLSIARSAGELRYEWAQKGITLALTDTLIAATAMHHKLTVITENVKDFPMPELQLHPLAGEAA
jgi:predicted nucleic acid-binding protein